MGYEDIEPPSSEMDRLYRAIVSNYKTGKYSSQEEALSILESQYCFSFVDIKEQLSKDFEMHPFYRWGVGGIDEYIRVCENSEISPSSKERNIYTQIIDGIIKKMQKSDEECDEPELIRSYDEIASLIYMQVEKIRKLCRTNRENKRLYKKYKVEIENMLNNHSPLKMKAVQEAIRPVTKESENMRLQQIVQDCPHLKKQDSGRYFITSSMYDFATWLMAKGFIYDDDNPDKDDITAEFIFSHFDSKCKKLESIEKQFRLVKGPKKPKSG